VPVFVRLNSSQEPIRRAAISSPPSTQLKEKKDFFKTVPICHREFKCNFLVLYGLQFLLLVGEFCQMTWTFQNLILSQNQQYVELKKLPYKKIFCAQEHLKNKLFHY
jgi:hypothetical protein